VLDTIAISDSAQICADALSSSTAAGPLLYINLMGIQNPRSDVASVFPLGYTITGERFVIEEQEWVASPEDFELGNIFATLAERLLNENLIKSHPVQLMEGGLEGVLDGMQYLKDGKVSGVKIVYRIGEAL
jgi:hypothetical protein